MEATINRKDISTPPSWPTKLDLLLPSQSLTMPRVSSQHVEPISSEKAHLPFRILDVGPSPQDPYRITVHIPARPAIRCDMLALLASTAHHDFPSASLRLSRTWEVISKQDHGHFMLRGRSMARLHALRVRTSIASLAPSGLWTLVLSVRFAGGG